MYTKALIYRALNVLCSADITHVLLLNTCELVPRKVQSGHRCLVLDLDRLSTLSGDPHFSISQSFLEDFLTLNFCCVACEVNNEIVSLCFLMPGHVPARHNSGGHRFNGIAMDLPAATQYLFKVQVRPAYRGQGIAAAMIGHAIEHFGVDQLKAIITTTDWTNQSFISSVRRLGFRKLGFASEFRFAGTCMYLMSDEFFSGPSS